MKDNQFFDINKFPKGYGIIVMPISISRTEHGTGQDPDQCFDYINELAPDKVVEPKIGVNLFYGDYLYLHSSEQARSLKSKFMNIVIKHKNTIQKIFKKNYHTFQIQHGFSYNVWNQLYLSYQGDFSVDFNTLKKLYQDDAQFQKYLKDDAVHIGRSLDEDQVNFFLEEFFILYLISKKKISLPNEYVLGREDWVLWAYPGVPLKGMAYVYQKNFLNLHAPENPYQNHTYDLESKKLVDYMRIDLATYDYQYED